MNKRVASYDLARAMAMIFVIVFHMNNNLMEMLDYRLWYAFDTIVITCNGIFFMISGKFLLEKEINNIPRFYIDRLVKVVIPVIVATVGYFFARHDFQISIGTIKGCIKAIIQNGGQGYFWFIYTLVCLYLLTPFLQKMLKSCSDKWIIILIIQSVIFMFIMNVFEILNLSHEFKSYSFYNWLLFFIMGYSIDRLVKKPQIENAILIFAGLMYVLNIAEMFMGINNPSNWNYSISYLSMCCGMYVLITRKMKNIAEKCSKIINIVASVSFIMYIMHGLTMEIFQRIICVETVNLGTWSLINIAVVVMTFIVSLPIYYFLYKPLIKLFEKCRSH